MSQPTVNNAQVIARNSFWYGLELVFSIAGAMVTSILVARAIGPVKLSYFNLIVWLTNITASVSAFGLQTAARKYMAEYLNLGDRAVARAIYLSALKLQAWIAGAVTILSLAAIYFFGEAGYGLISVLLVLNMAPRMIAYIPSQANNADEAMKRNTGPALAGAVVTIAVTLVSLWAGWGLTGVAAGTALGPMLETALKLWSVERWLGGVEAARIPQELQRRMRSFSGQSIALMVLNLTVWDRSDILFLQALHRDPTQLTFFSTAFNLVERLLMVPNAFSISVGATMMAQYGRGKEQLGMLTMDSTRYSFLASFPVLGGLACVSGALVRIYGPAYAPMGGVLAIVALFAIPKALMVAPTNLLQAVDKQRYLIIWVCIGGAVDVLLDIVLIPRYGAIGAAYAKGIAQAVATFGVWFSAWRLLRLEVQWRPFVRIAAAGVIMGAAVLAILQRAPGYAGLALAIGAGAVVWASALRIFGALDDADAQRLMVIGRLLPGRTRPLWTRLIGLIVPGAKLVATAPAK